MALLPEDPQKRKQVLIGGLLIGLIAYGGHDRLIRPRGEEVATLQTRLDGVEVQNTTARALVQGGGAEDVEQRLGRYRAQLQGIEKLIPSTEELPEMLDAISIEAQRTGVELSLIQPTGATEEQFYTRRQYDLAVIGDYHAIGEFLTRVASLPRIITPSGLSLAPSGAAEAGTQGRLEARFSVETYVLPPTGPAPPPAPDSAAAAAAAE